MTNADQHDREFDQLRGNGKRRHREECYSNALHRNEVRATMREPRCKMCEIKLDIELR